MNKEEIEKQIEAVRGLVKGWNLVYHDINARGEDYGKITEAAIDDIEIGLRTLTQTLKPYLNGQKLEV